jgi:hypothetical protein
MGPIEILTLIAFGAGNGAAFAIFGYIKANKIEDFDTKKFLLTIIIGAVIGGVAGFSGMTFVNAEAWLINMGILTGLIFFVENGIKIIWRRFFKKE